MIEDTHKYQAGMEMNYREAEEYLRQVNKTGSVLGLDSIKCLLERLGNPQKDLKAVHAAGTNGKGSTMAFLQSILMEAGYKVGRYSSPAVFDEWEIISVNNQYIEKDLAAEILSCIKEKCDDMVKEGLAHPTIFEIQTAMAFCYFKKRKCDIVLVECGMGGECDATNVFEKVLCSIITTISLDHMNFLGDTIEKIAKVKAGIIKEKCPVVVAKQKEESISVIQTKAAEKNAEYIMADKAEAKNIEGFKTDISYKASDGCVYCAQIKVMGTYQLINAATAVEVALVLNKQGFKVEKYIETGLSNTVWNGRMEVVNKNPLMLIDGAHNPGAVEELGKTIDLYFTNKRITFIMGVLADKDFDTEARIIADRAECIITVTPDNIRALDGRKLEENLKSYNKNVRFADSLKKAYDMAECTVKDGHSDMILAFGSLTYLGKLKSIIQNSRTNS